MLPLFSFFKKKQQASIANINVSFGQKGNATQYLKEGWRPAEENRQWSVGPLGRIQLPLGNLHPTEQTYLVMKLSAFVVPHVHNSQRVTLMVNGSKLDEFRLSSPSFCHKVFCLPPVILDEKILDVAFHTPDSKSPADTGTSPDNDRLGICLMYLIVVQEPFLENLKNKPTKYIFHSQDEYSTISTEAMTDIRSRQIFEQVLAFRHTGNDNWNFPGHCSVCEQDTLFNVSREDAPAGDIDINYREQLICAHCRQKNRHRLLLSTVLTTVPDIASSPMQIYIYEQISTFFEFLVKHLKPAVVIGSEYLGGEFISGSIINSIRHEDAMHLSFDDESFDVLISCDVFEHVPDIDRVFAEACRVLRLGGHLFFTVPFDARIYASVKRAQRKGNNEIDFFCPPEYHGNPLDTKGSLVFHDFGWDLLQRCKEAGFATAHAISCWDANSGYLVGDGNYVFVAKKGI